MQPTCKSKMHRMFRKAGSKENTRELEGLEGVTLKQCVVGPVTVLMCTFNEAWVQ